MQIINRTYLSVLLLIATGLTACKEADFVKNVKARTYETSSITYGEVTFFLDKKSVDLAMGEIVVSNPDHPEQLKSKIRVYPSNNNTAVELTFDIQDVMDDLPPSSVDDTLPNGLKIPVTGGDPSKLRTYLVGDNKNKLYLNINADTGDSMVGFAFVINDLEPGAQGSLFIPFEKNEMSGAAGFYVGPGEMQSGLGLFVSVKDVFNDNPNGMRSMSSANTSNPFSYLMQVPGTKAYMEMQKILNNKRTENSWF